MTDLINGCFEWIGGFLVLYDCIRLVKDREVKGLYWPSRAFFTVWGLWNIYYYIDLNQPFSFLGGLFLAATNLVWVGLALKFTRKESNES